MGLFGYIGEDGEVKDVDIEGMEIVSYVQYRETFAGALAGVNHGTISNSHVEVDITEIDMYDTMNYKTAETRSEPIVDHPVRIGGLVGSNIGTIYDCGSFVDLTGFRRVGGLAGVNSGTISRSHSDGAIGYGRTIGGLIGYNTGDLENSYFAGNVEGSREIGGLVGSNTGSIFDSYVIGSVKGERHVGGLIGDGMSDVVNSHYDIDSVTINGGHHVTFGGLYHGQYMDWLDGMELDIEDYSHTLVPVGDHYEIREVQGFRDMLGFAWHGGNKFRMTSDLDFTNSPSLHIPYFAGEFCGNDHTIHSVRIDQNFTSYTGLFGYIEKDSSISDLNLIDMNITGGDFTGGIIGYNRGDIKRSTAQGSVSGFSGVGGLVGHNRGTIEETSASGTIHGTRYVGGLVGRNEDGRVYDSHFSEDRVSGGNQVGGLIGLNDEGGTVHNTYSYGYVMGNEHVGGLLGYNIGKLDDSYSQCDVEGNSRVGGLVGNNWGGGRISDSYAMGDVDGNSWVGGLVGDTRNSQIKNSYYDLDSVQINGASYVTIGGLFHEQFNDWLTNNMQLEISDYKDTLVPSDHHFEIDGIQGIRDLLGFSDRSEYGFRLVSDIDLASEPGLFIPYISTDFNGNGHKISNLSLEQPFSYGIGMFGINDRGSIRNLRLKDISVSGGSYVGGLVGSNRGTIANTHVQGTTEGDRYVGGIVGSNLHRISTSSSRGDVNGQSNVGGLVGYNWDRISNSYSKNSVRGQSSTGGLTGQNYGSITDSYSVGQVTSTRWPGGLVGNQYQGTAVNSFWDVETSGLTESDGGTGMTTSEMKDVNTYIDAGWDITAVDDPDDIDHDHIWNIVDGETYPFLTGKEDTGPRASWPSWLILAIVISVISCLSIGSLIYYDKKTYRR